MTESTSLLDILMPNKEGIETLIEVKRRFPDLTVLAMSAGTSRYGADFLDIATKFGAAAALKKAFKVQVLLDLIEGKADDRIESSRH
jgi:DNA-binding NtrC family response regulator